MHRQLKRSLTWHQGTAMAVGAVLGSGILILPAITADMAGPASLFAWIAMALLAFPIALSLAKLGAMFPDAGGIVAFARMAFGTHTAQITGWLFLGTIPMGVPIVALAGANYAAEIFPIGRGGIVLIAAAMLLVSLALNYRGIEVAGKVQLVVVVAIALMLVVASVTAVPFVHLRNFQPLAPHGWMPVGSAALAIFWSFVGWEMVAHLAEEFKNPGRDLRISLSLGPLVVGIMYVSVAFVTVGTHVYGFTGNVAPLSALVAKSMGGLGAQMTGLLALAISFSAVHTNIAGFSRMVYAQARTGDFPSIFAKLHSSFRTPVVALLTLSVPFTLELIIEWVFHIDLGDLIRWPSVIFLVLYMIAMSSAVRLLSGAYRFIALIPLIACTILYPFSGWASIYPLVLALVAGVWVIVKSRRHVKTNRLCKDEQGRSN